MADSHTTNYNWTLPEVGGSPDTWGGKLNQNWKDVDGKVHDIEQTQNSHGGQIDKAVQYRGKLNASADPLPNNPDKGDLYEITHAGTWFGKGPGGSDLIAHRGDSLLNDGADWQMLRTGDLKSGAYTEVQATPTSSSGLMEAGAFGLGSPITLTSSDDLDNVHQPGFYQWSGDNIPKHVPNDLKQGGMLVYRMDTDLDRAQDVFSNSSRAFRVAPSTGGDYGPWKYYWHTGNLPGNADLDNTAGYITSIHPTMTTSATFKANSNSVDASGSIVNALDLEPGDVVQISGASKSANNKVFTVEDTLHQSVIYCNQVHADVDGPLHMADESTNNITFKRIAKWHSAAPGVGQAWVSTKSIRPIGTAATNNTGRAIIAQYMGSSPGGDYHMFFDIRVDGVRLTGSDSYPDSASARVSCNVTVPAGSDWKVESGSNVSMDEVWELR